MNSFPDGLSPSLLASENTQLQSAREFWAGVSELLANAGETHGGLLEALATEVEDVFSRCPVDLNRVKSLTAEAAYLLSGSRYF